MIKFLGVLSSIIGVAFLCLAVYYSVNTALTGDVTSLIKATGAYLVMFPISYYGSVLSDAKL